MRKSVANSDIEKSSWGANPPMLNGTPNPAFFRELQRSYQSKTGYNLVLSDLNGSIQMGLPDCDKFPCMRSCRECREQIVSEALRTGKVCVDSCHEGYIIWGLPFAVNGKTLGGLIVIGGEVKAGRTREEFDDACSELYQLMLAHDILPEMDTSVITDLEQVHRFVYRKDFMELQRKLEEYSKPLISCLKTAEFVSAEDCFCEVLNVVREYHFMPMDLLCGLVGEMIFRARRQFVDGGMDPYACYSEAGQLSSMLAGVKTFEDITEVLRAFYQRFGVLSRRAPKDPDDLLIEKATTYLEEHIRDDLTRESVAKAVGISPSHFSRLIREKKGRTFTDLLNQYRIERASTLLVRSPKTLAEIASETGFCDQSYFSKVFRRYKDVSPAKYREMQQF